MYTVKRPEFKSARSENLTSFHQHLQCCQLVFVQNHSANSLIDHCLHLEMKRNKKSSTNSSCNCLYPTSLYKCKKISCFTIHTVNTDNSKNEVPNLIISCVIQLLGNQGFFWFTFSPGLISLAAGLVKMY